MKDKLKDYILICIVSLIISLPIINQNFNIYGDDGIQHIARLMGTYQSIEEGQIIPVIMSQFCNGFGYSWNIFYSPLTAYIPLIFHIFTSSFELILKLFIILTCFLTGISMYEFVKKVTKNRYAGLLASIIYILAPYRLTDMYMRMAISELTSFIFLPIVFHGMYNIFNSEEKSVKKSLVLTLGATGLILTHSVIAMYAAFFCFIYFLINIKKLKDKKVLRMLAVNILLIILLTLFYTIPLLEHKINVDYEVFKPGRMEKTEELIRNKVDLIDLIYTKQNNFSFEIGLISIIGVVLTILAFRKVEKENRKIYWFSLICGIACIILSLRFFPFEKLPSILKMIQFTFRLLEFSSFFFAFVSAVNYALIIKNFNMKDVLVLGLIVFLLVIPLKKNLNFKKSWSEEALWPAVEVNENTGRVHAGCATFEYLPSKAFNNLEYIKKREDRVYVLIGQAIIQNEVKNETHMEFIFKRTENKEEQQKQEDLQLELPYIYYLGYNVELVNTENNQKTELDTFESENGFVEINIDKSVQQGKVTIQYTGTILMKVCLAISWITFISIVFTLIVIDVKNQEN